MNQDTINRPNRSERGNKNEIKALKERDNVTNFYYIIKVYAIMISTLALTLYSFSLVSANGLAWWWNIPMSCLAIIIIGASQHQLGGIIHEGTHYSLFANRKMSELVSDWLGAFPIYTSTYAFRVHHLAHHQFVNDPVRDPNFDQAKDSGHWLDFPLTHMELLWGTLKLLWFPNLVSYIFARAKYSAIGVDTNPYADKDNPGSPWTMRVGIMFAALVPVIITPLIPAGYGVLAGFILFGTWLATSLYYYFIPDNHYAKSVMNPVISHRMTAIGRFTFLAIVYGALTFIEVMTGAPAWIYFGLFWILPLFTTFPLFMILREWVQHGNADRGRYTNSRIFIVNPVLRYAVFPFGMDYHLPHHLYASVPHYKLKDLHNFMLKDEKYATQGVIVEGWVKPTSSDKNRPSIIDVLGPEYSPKTGDVHVDPSVLEHVDLNNPNAVDRQIKNSLIDGGAEVKS